MTASKYAFDHTHSGIHFTVRHMVVTKVHGAFDKWDGELEIDEQDLTKSRVKVTIEAASINTKLEQRDNHLRGADFFDVAKFPTLTFASKRVEKSGDEYKFIGDLTIRGVTREVALDVEFNGIAKSPWGDQRAGLSAKGSLDRRDFGLTWNNALETGGVLVGDKVEISIEVEAIKQAGTKAA